MNRGVDLLTRFWQKVEKTEGCWNWTAVTSEKGYGLFSINNRNQRAHRVSFEMSKWPIPGGAQVLHRCDNPRCVNPEHLFLGTNTENMADKVSKGRQAHYGHQGEKNWRAKLTEPEVLAIRAATESQGQLARRFGVSPRTISGIKTRSIWAHL